MNNEFKDLGLSKNVLDSIKKLNYDKPSKIQEELIPHIMNGDDCIGQAQTGTGKTLAFAAAVLSKLNKEKEGVKVMVLTPTRELAIQIAKEFNLLDQKKEFRTTSVYGGDSIDRQIKALKGGMDIVIGTPGRVKDLIKRKKLNLTTIDFFVLDEADEMLNMGFLEEIETILHNTSRDKQVLMMSATMPKQIKDLTKNYMKDNAKHIVIEAKAKTNDNIEQSYYLVNDKHRAEVLCRILDSKKLSKSIIFGRTKMECDSLVAELQSRGYKAETMHGDISQVMREKTLERFKKGTFKHLVATDVAARGIHVDNVDLIINYRLPQDNEAYVHRIGRTGRANNKGEAISLISPKDVRIIKSIAKFANCTINEKPIPESKDIMSIKYNELLSKIETMKNEDDLTESLEYVRDLNKADLISISAALLKYTITKEIGSNMTKDLSVKERSVSTVSDGKTRIFLNVGKMDGLKQGSLLDMIKEVTEMDKADFTNIEVLQTFTFIDVTSEVVNEFIDKFTGHKIKDRAVRIEISNNRPSKSNGRSNSSRGRSGSRNGSRSDSRNDSRGGNSRGRSSNSSDRRERKRY